MAPRFFKYTHGPYIVDFLCVDAKLVVELDGSQHHTAKGIAYDMRRDEHLRALGLTVMRFPDNECLKNTNSVLQAIYDFLQRAK